MPPTAAHHRAMRLHGKKKRKKNGRAKAPPPHALPPVMFCGECSSAAAPPPPMAHALFAASDAESPRLKCMHLRVHSAGAAGENGADGEGGGATGGADALRTMLTELDGVRGVVVARLQPEGEPAVDPNSCVVKIRYASPGDVATENPQEPKEDGEDPTRRAVLARLADAGFDCTILSDRDGDSPAPGGDAPDDGGNAVFHSINSNGGPGDGAPEPAAEVGPPSRRTRLRVRGICCAAEVPAVRSILRPLPGVRRVGVNLATRVAFVDHDPGVISAEALAGALSGEEFGAEVLTDGAKGEAGPSDLGNVLDMARSRFVESTLLLTGAPSDEGSESCPVGRVLRQNFFKDRLRAFHLHGPSRTLKVEHDPKMLSAERIRDVLSRGLGGRGDWGSVEVASDGAAEGLVLPETEDEGKDAEGHRSNEAEERFLKGMKTNVVVSGALWAVSLLGALGGSWERLELAGIGSVLFGMPPVVKKAWATLRRRQFDANCMMVTAAFGALALGEFDEAASVAFLFAVSEWLETRATRKGRRALEEIVSLRPEYANVVDPKTGGIVIVPAAKVPAGTPVSVRTGDKVPADGTVIEGTSSVDESSLTGEARPVDKRAGDDVSGGSINVGSARLVVRTTSTVGGSTLSHLIQLVEEAQANTSETEKLIDAFARKYTPAVLAVALLICTVPWVFGEETGRRWTLNGLIFVVIACPCALTISTPVTYSAGLAAAAQRGIIIKGGSKLEALGNVKTVLFDKTGTITTGRFALSNLNTVGGSKSRKEILELLALMEAPSSHPLSACLVSAAKDEGVAVPANVSLTEHTILKGEGVMANVDNRKVYVGNKRLFQRLGMYSIPPQHIESAKKWGEEGGTVGYLGIEGLGIIGMYCVKDTVREEAQDVVSCLHHSGIRVVMLTGDGAGAARAVGKEIGVAETNVQSQLLPEDKLQYVSGLKGSLGNGHASLFGSKKTILMVGDGVNDAPALSAADVGVAMGEGASLAMEMSDVTLMDSNLSKLLFSMKMGARVIETVKENIAFCTVVNSAAIVLTFMGKMTLLWAIASDVGVMLAVTVNGMKLLSWGAVGRRAASKRKDGRRYEQTADVELEMV